MVIIALCSSLLIGFVAHRSGTLALLVLPLTVSISFFLIADIDGPRAGLIRVSPQNLVSLCQSLHCQ